jgi:hypothetical protein
MFPRKLKTLLSAGSLVGLVFMSGCGEEITTTTRLLPGGGIERELSLENSKSEAPADWNPMPVDSTWAGSTTEARMMDAKNGETSYVHTLSRRFSSTREVRAALARHPDDGSMLVPEIAWAKKWSGFYSVYSFREYYPVPAVFRHNPAKEFFSPQEFGLLQKALEDEKSAKQGHSEEEWDALGDKYEKWIARSVAEDLFRALLLEADERRDSLASEWLRDGREAVLAAVIKVLDIPDHNPAKGPEPFVIKLDELLQTDLFRRFLERKSPALTAWEKRWRFIDGHLLNSFPFRLIMPGLITATNSQDMKGNTLSWKLEVIKLTLSDFEMTAESRAVNWWAVGLAGLFLVLLLALLVRGIWILRRRDRGGA